MRIQRFVRCALVTMLGITLLSHPALAAEKKQKVEVTFVSAELIDNQHVGNEWWWGGYVDGEEIEEGDSVTVSVPASGKITLTAEAQEQDKVPEEGSSEATVKLSSLGKNTVKKTLDVTVTENRGRYSGNTATWRFVFEIKKA
ncbi:hypothetical protein ACE6ED_02605 [Paenibacillus sp. CN-4]|uniref:hypothetical protein n=1 Tax=Paenibacillus nanchangensis TaxID=3348343 RepID=UPI00397BFB5C